MSSRRISSRPRLSLIKSLHHVLEGEALRVVGVDEADSHPRVLALGVAPGHLPSSSNGSGRAGMESLKRKRVPTGSGFRVLMKVPPLLMFRV